MNNVILRCIDCKTKYSNWNILQCNCGSILEVVHDFKQLKEKLSIKKFDERLAVIDPPYNSGVWRYKEIVLDIEDKFIISMPEGNTNLYNSERVSKYSGVNKLYLKAEGQNPTCSFKDRGMTTAISVAKMLGYKRVACASTGNTSASMSAYASIAGMHSVIFIPKENVTIGKLSQALAYGAKTLRINGNFDSAMSIVQRACKKFNMYLLNSINPFRIEGQKTIAFEALQQLKWKVPDWFVLPGGNLGNCSAIGKGLRELYELGLIRKLPRIAVIQAKGSNPFYLSYKENFKKFVPIKNPKTIASAIRIGNPVSWKKAKEVIEFTNGVVEEVTDQEIIDAKLIIDRAGIGCEPASASTVAGIKKLVKKVMINSSETILVILTGNILKDIDTIINYNEGKLDGIITKSPNLPKMVNSLDEIERALV